MIRIAVATLVVTLSAASYAAPTPARLTIGTSQEPDTLHPVITTMTSAVVMRNKVLHPITAVNEAFQWECWLCTQIPTIENGGAKLIEEGGTKKMLVTWEIRPEAVWGDGKPVTGEDMRLTWQIGTAPTVTKGSPAAFDGIEAVIVDKANPKKFTLKYKELRYDYNRLDSSFVPVPAHIEGPIFAKTKDQPEAYEKQTKYVTDPANPGLYNGPFRVTEIKPSSHVLMVANDKFYGQKPQIRSILYRVIPNTQTLEANLIAGGIDMIGAVGMTFDQALKFDKRLATDPALKGKFKVVWMDDFIYEHIDFNLTDPLVADVRVRRALLHAVDREAMCMALFEGKQKPAAHAFHPMSPYFPTDVKDYAFDPKIAEKLLDEAGWKKGGDGFRMKDGKRLTLQIMSTSQNKTRELVQVFLQEAWKKIGVQLTIRNQPARVFFGGTLAKREYGQLAMYATVLTSPGDIQYAGFHSSQMYRGGGTRAGSNYSGWDNPKVDGWLQAAKTELDEGKRKAIMKNVIDALVADAPQVPLFYRVSLQVIPAALDANQPTGVVYPAALKAQLWTIGKTAH